MQTATAAAGPGRRGPAATSLVLAIVVAFGLASGAAIGSRGIHVAALVVSMLALAVLILLRQDELLAAGVLAVSLYFDWYLGVYIVALLMTAALLVIFYVGRSSERPWVTPRPILVWAALLVLALYPAVHGALTVRDTLIYYPGVIVGALLAFWLGNVVARNPETLRRFYMILTAFAVSIAIHAIIQRELHVTLLGSPSQEAYVSQANNYLLEVGNGIARVGSFFINPDFAGMFFATVVFVPLALYASTTSLLGRVCYLTAAVVMLPALLFTFSASSALAIGVGAVVFLLLLGDMRARLKLLAALGVGSAVLAIGFASQIQLLIEHGTQPKEAAERQALWQGAVRAIEANPLTGVGLGHRAYLLRADAIYHLPAELRPFDHPHNSYLELGAMAGLPVLGVFLALLACALWLALRNWKSADPRTRVLLAAGIAGTIALSFNSWLNEGWTLPPLAALGWMNLGMIGSPLLRNALGHTGAQREHEAPEASP